MVQRYIPLRRGLDKERYVGIAHMVADDVRDAVADRLRRPLYAQTLDTRQSGQSYVVVDIYRDRHREGKPPTRVRRAFGIRIDKKNRRLALVYTSGVGPKVLERALESPINVIDGIVNEKPERYPYL